MNQHKTLYYFPHIYDSFCLKILEAEMCGMKVIADSPRIGIYSYNQPLDKLTELVNSESLTIILDALTK